MSYLQKEPMKNGRSSVNKNDLIKTKILKQDCTMSPVNTKDIEGFNYEAADISNKI